MQAMDAKEANTDISSHRRAIEALPVNMHIFCSNLRAVIGEIMSYSVNSTHINIFRAHQISCLSDFDVNL
jgi:hypothetical protein